MPVLVIYCRAKVYYNVVTENNKLPVSISQQSGHGIAGFSALGLSRLRWSCQLHCVPLWRLRVIPVVSKVQFWWFLV